MDGSWHIDIRPWSTWTSTQGTWDRSTQNSLGGGTVHNSSSATGDNIGWDVALTAGTWTLTIIHTSTTGGDDAIDVKLDAAVIGTFDNVTGNNANRAAQITGIVVSADAVYRLSFTTTDNKTCRLQHLTLSRTT